MLITIFFYRPAIATWYSLSYLYYSVLAVITSIVLGLSVSFATGKWKCFCVISYANIYDSLPLSIAEDRAHYNTFKRSRFLMQELSAGDMT